MSDAITKAAEQPVAPKTWIQQFVDRARESMVPVVPPSAATYGKGLAATFGEYAEGGVTGAVLGAAHAKWGLDTKGGPVDGWLAGAGALLSVGLVGHLPAVAEHARKVGSQAFTVYSFRKGFEAVKHEPYVQAMGKGVQRVAIPRTGPGAPHKDPIEEVAKDLA